MTNVKAIGRDRPDKSTMSKLRPLVAIVTALALVLAGVATAAATAQGPITEMVICGGNGPETIHLDSQGNPVKGDPCCECLNCMLTAVDLPPAIAGVGLLIDQTRAAPFRKDDSLFSPPSQLRPMPRGPPPTTVGNSCRSSGIRLFPAAFETGQVQRGKAKATGGQQTQVAR